MDTCLKHYLETVPQYQETVQFLQTIFDFQAALAKKIEFEPKEMEQSEVVDRWQANQPLLTGEMHIDPTLFHKTLTHLRPLLSSDDTMQDALNRLLTSEAISPPNIDTLLNDLQTNGETRLNQLADDITVAPDTPAFLLQIVLSPFFEKAAQPHQKWIEKAQWRGGNCPMCGSEPVMARLTREEGQRIFTCSLCHTEWPFARLHCPFCEDTNSLELNYFTLDDDKTYRVDCCDKCQRYLKTVDERVVNYPINILVENEITAHLDAVATEQGYQ